MTKLTICMGSACHQMGVYETVTILRKLLDDHRLQDLVELKGAFCMGACGAGIVLAFEDKQFLHVNPGTIEAIFNEEILPHFVERAP